MRSLYQSNPTKCHLCGGAVVFVPNHTIYNGHSYGSGYAYQCQDCKAHTGTHNSHHKRTALGIVANEEMRKLRMKAHALFDPMWKYKKMSRAASYRWLSKEMGLPFEQCHFGHFNIEQLNQAIDILTRGSMV